VQYLKVIHSGEDFDRGMIDRGMRKKQCPAIIPLSIIPAVNGFSWQGPMRKNRQRNVRQRNKSRDRLFPIPLPILPACLHVARKNWLRLAALRARLL
jgi:hypothetical protein